MNRKISSKLHGAAILMLVFALAGCSQPTPQPPPVPKTYTPSKGHNAMQLPTRAIIYFQQATTDSNPLSVAIAKACHCQPVFFRPYLNNALIYEIALPPDHTFAAFAEALMRDGAKLGVKAVEQDSIMQHQ